MPVQKIKTVIHLGQSTGISCKSQVGVVERKTPLLFRAYPLKKVVAKKGANNYFQTPVTNMSSTDITIKKNEVIIKLQLVSSTVPLPVKKLKSTDSEQSYKLKQVEPSPDQHQNRLIWIIKQKSILTILKTNNNKKEYIQKVISQINLSDLT